MRKIYKELTKEQKERGVIFSSTLSKQKTEQPQDIIHEVTNENLHACSPGKNKIDLLLDDKWFTQSPWKYNIIRR